MSLDFSNLGPSLVRTLVPFLVGLLGSTGATAYLHVTSAQETTVLTFVVGYGYYLTVRLAEHQWPALGILLGIPQAPTYPGVPVPAPAGPVAPAAGPVVPCRPANPPTSPAAPAQPTEAPATPPAAPTAGAPGDPNPAGWWHGNPTDLTVHTPSTVPFDVIVRNVDGNIQ